MLKVLIGSAKIFCSIVSLELAANTKKTSKQRNMADQLNLGGLSLAESQHANSMNGRSTYIPPHMRGVNGGPPPGMDGPPQPMMHGNMNNGVWNTQPK